MMDAVEWGVEACRSGRGKRARTRGRAQSYPYLPHKSLAAVIGQQIQRSLEKQPRPVAQSDDPPASTGPASASNRPAQLRHKLASILTSSTRHAAMVRQFVDERQRRVDAASEPASKSVASTAPLDGVCCPICLERITKFSDCGPLPCGHVFHKTCIREWASRRRTCPVDRLEFGWHGCP